MEKNNNNKNDLLCKGAQTITRAIAGEYYAKMLAFKLALEFSILAQRCSLAN